MRNPIKKILLRCFLLLLFTWLFLISLLVQAPVAWFVYQAQEGWLAKHLPEDVGKNLHSFKAQTLTGRLGKGAAQGVQLENIQLAAISWQLPWWRLALLQPLIYLQVGAEPQPWHLRLALKSTTSLNLRIQAGSLEIIQGLPIKLQGHLKGWLTADLTWSQGQLLCQKIEGDWQGFAHLHAPFQVDLGQLSLYPSCSSLTSLNGLITAELVHEHQVALQVQVRANAWSFTGQAQVNQEAELGDLLQMLGWHYQSDISAGQFAPGRQLEAKAQFGL